MCDRIVFPNGMVIDQFPQPYTKADYSKPIKERSMPTPLISCLCSYPPEAIEEWLKSTFPEDKYLISKDEFGWEIIKR